MLKMQKILKGLLYLKKGDDGETTRHEPYNPYHYQSFSLRHGGSVTVGPTEHVVPEHKIQ